MEDTGWAGQDCNGRLLVIACHCVAIELTSVCWKVSFVLIRVFVATGIIGTSCLWEYSTELCTEELPVVYVSVESIGDLCSGYERTSIITNTHNNMHKTAHQVLAVKPT